MTSSNTRSLFGKTERSPFLAASKTARESSCPVEATSTLCEMLSCPVGSRPTKVSRTSHDGSGRQFALASKPQTPTIRCWPRSQCTAGWRISCQRRLPVIIGPPESGKTTLSDTLRLFCRRGLSSDDITAAALAQACLLILHSMIDESDLDHGSPAAASSRRQQSRPCGLAQELGADVYGAKVICCEDPPDDPALVSRCIVVRMSEVEATDLKKPSDPEMLELSREIQAQLLRWRFDHYRTIVPAKISGAEQLHPRERDLLAALAAPFAED